MSFHAQVLEEALWHIGMSSVSGPEVPWFKPLKRLKIINNAGSYRSTVAQMAARSPHDRKAVGSNPAGSYETRF